jgi:hypothetical protein
MMRTSEIGTLARMAIASCSTFVSFVCAAAPLRGPGFAPAESAADKPDWPDFGPGPGPP